MSSTESLTAVWIDKLGEYPIYRDITHTPLYNSSYDVSLPLAAVYLQTFLHARRPEVTFRYHPRRLYEAEGRLRPLEELANDGDVVLVSCSTADSPDAQRILRVAKYAGKVTVVG